MEREKAKSFRDLIVWQKAHEMVLSVYAVTKTFPKEELFALVSQVRRSSTSIAANIAEGFKKKGTKDKLRMLNISQGSLSETEYYFILSKDLGYIKADDLTERASEVGRLLEAYMKAIRGNGK
jgi:four helix bundle protein